MIPIGHIFLRNELRKKIRKIEKQKKKRLKDIKSLKTLQLNIYVTTTKRVKEKDLRMNECPSSIS